MLTQLMTTSSILNTSTYTLNLNSGLPTMNNEIDETLCIPSDLIIEEYEYARTEYKGSFRDSERDFWDGYMTAIEKLCSDVVLDLNEQ
jgi:hypothetical protein